MRFFIFVAFLYWGFATFPAGIFFAMLFVICLMANSLIPWKF